MTTERLVEIVKNAGQSIVDNAESIVGDFKYQTKISVSFIVDMTGISPEIKVSSLWIPEKEIENNERVFTISND